MKTCKKDGFVFRKTTIPADLGDDVTGQAKPENGAYTNAYVEYEANGAQYMYDSYGVYTKTSEGEGVKEFNQLLNRPSYAGVEMTSLTSIPDVTAAEERLQKQIDAISASSDVTDIVGTYAELENYDTSTLGDNDIIKVLQDEAHNNETTYYRWDEQTSSFTLIGEEGPYYTKSAADAKFQDKLTAGNNIVINGNTISAKAYTAGQNVTITPENVVSAKDTTYSAGTGLKLVDTIFTADTSILATQTDLTNGLATKQNTLTAGSNIDISSDTISATDTKYTFEDTENGWSVTGSDGTEFSHSDAGGGELSQDIIVNNPIGRYNNGDIVAAGTSFETIFRSLLTNVYYPTLTNPSANLAYSASSYVKVGSTISARTATLTLNRGSINPQYSAESPYRSGAATNYTLITTGADVEYTGTSTSSGTFNVDALTRSTKGDIVLTGTVNYAQGVQPKDSDGNNYRTPLAAGSVSSTRKITFVQPFYWGVSNSRAISDFTGLTESVTTKSDKTVSYTTNNQYMVFAYDADYGNLTSILDPNSFETISGWSKSTLTIDGFTYNVYVANSATTDTDAAFTFKF